MTLVDAAKLPCVAICIATYRRPHLLARLLDSLMVMVLPTGCRVEVRIVDNDHQESARAVAMGHRCVDRFPLRYAVAPQRNIASARNAALEMAEADWLAFIDDDEAPHPAWLLELLRSARENFDVVIGDVLPEFAVPPRRWLVRGRFYHKSSKAVLDGNSGWQEARTSNALLRGRYVYQHGIRFNEDYGRTGGEDTDFFKRVMLAGGQLCGAPQAIVTEYVHEEQMHFGWLARRFWRCGQNYERLVACGHGLHPLWRFAGRCVRSGVRLACSLPLILVGRVERAATALLELVRAAGGVSAWLRPDRSGSASGYQSSGIMEDRS